MHGQWPCHNTVWRTWPMAIVREYVFTFFENPKNVTFYGFLARDSMLSALYAIARPSAVRPSVRLSVCPSVTRVDQSKTVERIIEILSPSFHHSSFSTPKVVA